MDTLNDGQMAELLLMLLHDAAHVHSIRTAARPYNYALMRERLLSDDGAAGQIPADEYV